MTSGEDRKLEPPPRRAAAILVADADAGVADLVAKVLRLEGFEVETCDRGLCGAAERLTAPDAPAAALVVGDPATPAEFGSLHMLASRGTRVLCIASRPEDELAARGLRKEGLRFLAKPFRPEDLVAAVRAALETPA